MRAGKVLALRVGDVTLDPGREALRVREPKNGSERMVVLGATATPKALRGLRTHLRTLHGAAPSEILFRSTRGTAVSYDALHYQWAGICAATGLVDEAGAPRYTLHQLRHTRGSALIAQGQRVEIVRRDRAARARPPRYPLDAGLRRVAGGAGPGRAGDPHAR